MVRIVAFDPSSTNLGWASGTADVDTRGMHIHATGCITDKVLKSHIDGNIPMDWPTKYKLITAISNAVKAVLDQECPDIIFIEHPFNYRFPHVFSVLVVAVHEIHRAVIFSNSDKKPHPYMVSPAEAKKLVTTMYNDDGTVFTAHKADAYAKKDPVRVAVLNHKFITFESSLDTELMSEHEYDACAIMYAGLELLSGRHIKPTKKKNV